MGVHGGEKSLNIYLLTHRWPSTQCNGNVGNLAAHHWAAHNPAARWCAGTVVCNLPPGICRESHVGWPNFAPTSVLSSWHWAVSPAYIAVWLVRLLRELPIWVTHTAEPAHHRATGLCAAQWCAARLSTIRLGLCRGSPVLPIDSINHLERTVDHWYLFSCPLCFSWDLVIMNCNYVGWSTQCGLHHVFVHNISWKLLRWYSWFKNGQFERSSAIFVHGHPPWNRASIAVAVWIYTHIRVKNKYRKISNIRRTKFQNISDSRPVVQLSLRNLLKPCVKSRMRM